MSLEVIHHTLVKKLNETSVVLLTGLQTKLCNKPSHKISVTEML